MHRIFAAVVGGALVIAAPSRAEPFKCPPPGTTLKYSDGGALRHDGRDGMWCPRTTAGGKPFAAALGHVAFYNRDRASGDVYEKWLKAVAQLWPIEPGKSVSFRYQTAEDGSSANAFTGNITLEEEVTVEAPRSITVGAGTFVVYPLVILHKGVGTTYHRSSRTYYYAPELGANVKFEFRLISGSMGQQPKNWEVVAITPPK
jgi:hypothetical protein